ncbi:hypothetical protein V1227_03500 [Lentzea sp. DG1S-22]|nr:hypothetical protein [Lentzea sp. DG1S-22]WVH81832.1 hypothetical protein V1227_03500 [Lentzea sp. DG1S-22]
MIAFRRRSPATGAAAIGLLAALPSSARRSAVPPGRQRWRGRPCSR